MNGACNDNTVNGYHRSIMAHRHSAHGEQHLIHTVCVVIGYIPPDLFLPARKGVNRTHLVTYRYNSNTLTAP